MDSQRFAALQQLDKDIKKHEATLKTCADFKGQKYRGAIPKAVTDYINSEAGYALEVVNETERRLIVVVAALKEKFNSIL